MLIVEIALIINGLFHLLVQNHFVLTTNKIFTIKVQQKKTAGRCYTNRL